MLRVSGTAENISAMKMSRRGRASSSFAPQHMRTVPSTVTADDVDPCAEIANEYATLHRHFKERERVLVVKDSELDAKSREIGQLKARIAELERKIAERAAMGTAVSHQPSSGRRTDSLAMQLLIDENTRLKNANRWLQEQIDNKKRHSSDEGDHRGDRGDTIRVPRSSSDLDSLRAQLAQLQAENEELKRRPMDTSGRLTTNPVTGPDNRALRDEIVSLNAQIDDLKTKLAASDARILALEADNVSLKQNLQSRESKIRELQALLDQSNGEQRRDTRSFEQHAQRFLAKIQELTDLVARRDAKITELEDLVARRDADITDLKTMIEQLNDRLNAPNAPNVPNVPSATDGSNGTNVPNGPNGPNGETRRDDGRNVPGDTRPFAQDEDQFRAQIQELMDQIARRDARITELETEIEVLKGQLNARIAPDAPNVPNGPDGPNVPDAPNGPNGDTRRNDGRTVPGNVDVAPVPDNVQSLTDALAALAAANAEKAELQKQLESLGESIREVFDKTDATVDLAEFMQSLQTQQSQEDPDSVDERARTDNGNELAACRQENQRIVEELQELKRATVDKLAELATNLSTNTVQVQGIHDGQSAYAATQDALKQRLDQLVASINDVHKKLAVGGEIVDILKRVAANQDAVSTLSDRLRALNAALTDNSRAASPQTDRADGDAPVDEIADLTKAVVEATEGVRQGEDDAQVEAVIDAFRAQIEEIAAKLRESEEVKAVIARIAARIAEKSRVAPIIRTDDPGQTGLIPAHTPDAIDTRGSALIESITPHQPDSPSPVIRV